MTSGGGRAGAAITHGFPAFLGDIFSPLHERLVRISDAQDCLYRLIIKIDCGFLSASVLV